MSDIAFSREPTAMTEQTYLFRAAVGAEDFHVNHSGKLSVHTPATKSPNPRSKKSLYEA